MHQAQLQTGSFLSQPDERATIKMMTTTTTTTTMAFRITTPDNDCFFKVPSVTPVPTRYACSHPTYVDHVYHDTHCEQVIIIIAHIATFVLVCPFPNSPLSPSPLPVRMRTPFYSAPVQWHKLSTSRAKKG